MLSEPKCLEPKATVEILREELNSRSEKTKESKNPQKNLRKPKMSIEKPSKTLENP